MRADWRLLLDDAGTGDWNMATDEVLLETAIAGGPATLRFYRWDAAWLSLGYGQQVEASRIAACEAAGVGVVRRATGGSAVLHGADLTYAIASREEGLPAGLAATYALVAEALLAAFAGLGIAAETAPRNRPADPRADSRSFDCFAAPAGDEICVAGRKLVGSAQRRSGGGVLQHGSIRLEADPESVRRATGLAGQGSTSLREQGCAISAPDLADACAEAFAARLGGVFERAELAAAERDRVAESAFERPERYPFLLA